MSADWSVTPHVPAEFPVRLVARGLDVLVLAAADVGLGRAIGFGFDWLLIGSAMVFFYFSLLDTLAGATLGKLALGLRVLGPDGGRPTLRQSLRREAFTLVGSIPLIGPLLALVTWVVIGRTLGKSPLRQGNHDLLAGGTRVIQLRPRGR